MFQPDRLFAVLNQNLGIMEWYFQAREGDSGPFTSRAHAERMLQDFVEICIEKGFTGGRG